LSSRFNTVRQFLAEIRGVGRDRFAGVIDFSYQHYALGDALTTQVNLACLAQQSGCSGIDIYLIADPAYPAARTQSFVTTDNYSVHLDNLFPAFLCLPQLTSLRIIRDPMAAGLIWTSLVASRTPKWPSLRTHLRRRMSYPLGHEIINAFQAREGHIPRLAAPRGYGSWAREFRNQHWPEQFIVCINPRQGRLANVATTTYRDSPLAEWHAFIDESGTRYPNVHFLMLGGFAEWDSSLTRRPNVSIPRVMGLTLAHELALLAEADVFMGTSSGFATMATFTSVPYVITNIEPLFALWAGVEAGAPRYPFAMPNQHLVWKQEDREQLLASLESVYDAVSARSAPNH
jgi:hypothetical protein